MVRTKRLSTLLACALGILSPIAAKADGDFNLPRWYTGVNAGYFFNEGDNLENGQQYNLALGYNFNRRWALEGQVGIQPNVHDRVNTQTPGESAIGVKFQADALYSLSDPGLRSLDPYVSFGGGATVFDEPVADGSVDPYAGVGLGVNYNVNEKWFVRPDYRAQVELKDYGRVDHQAVVTVGYRWGGDMVGGGGMDGENAAEAKGIGDMDAARELDKVYYAYDSSRLDERAKASLQKNAQWLKTNGGKNVTVAGHCDERGTNEYNMALGMRRAQSAYEYLRSLGIPAERMSTISYGEEFPADPGHNEAAWSKNRRAEFIFGKK